MKTNHTFTKTRRAQAPLLLAFQTLYIMKKSNLRLWPLLLLMLLVEASIAENVDRGRARQAATTFLNNNGAQTRGLTDVTSATGFSNVYVFTTENSFVLMAADDRVQPILGYSLNGQFDIENMPDNKRAWIEEYTHEIQYAIAHHTRASAEVTQQWRDLVEGRPNAGRATTAVSPLLQTQWDQFSPYNMLCPGGSVTGCVATAMAQIMKYWNYPSHGIGSHSYDEPTYGVLSADFQSTTYDWNNMINNYNSSYNNAQKKAVATLMFHCGVSVDMEYSTSGSGASTAAVAYALKTYFGYSDDAQHLSRSAYSDADWIALLKSELNNSRPIQYHGSGSGGGHSFVFDGYNNSNYFHVNWGWSGSCDEYYAVSNLNPGPGGTGSGAYGIYNDNQGAVVGIHPSGSAANAPTNLTYSQNGRTVTLSWSAATGASSYKVYRNNSFIGNASSTSYTDTAPYGSSVYYVRSVDSQGRLSLSSNAVTVNVAYPTPVVDDLAATVSGNNVNLSWTAPDWCYPSTPTATLTYGSGDYYAALGLNGSYALYWGHRYLASNLSSYNNMKVYKVSFYANETGNYKVYIYKGTNSDHPQTLLQQQSFSVGTIGWCDVDLSSPIQIDASKDLWVFIYDPEYRSYPATYSSYSGSDGNYYSTSPASWVNSYDGAAFLIRTFVSDGTYTYNLYRNGSCIANHVNGTSYSDTNLADGTYSYYLKTNYYAGESESSNQVSATIFNSIPGSGTEQNPYIITTTAQLDALANAVKGGTNFSGTYFVLGNDIAYSTAGLGSTDENFTTIGGYFNGSDKNFSGIFDGQGHAISGIRLCKPLTNQHENKNQALFGRAVGATVKNVTLADASITGYRIVAGIVGHCENSTVQNCLVVNSSITSADTYVGAVIGKDQYGNTFTTNHYMGCTVNGTTNATNVGVGGNGVGTSYSNDHSGVRSVHALTLGENITATGESVTYQGTTYYASNTTITLGHELSGYWATYYVNGVAIAGTTFTMPAEDVSVTATWMPDPTHFEMTAIDEYTIHTATGWDLFCDALQDNTFFNHFIGMTVKLDADISVVRMAGSSGHEFGGTFDGQGHTLTVDYTTTVQITAPFRCVNGATIMNLVTAGTINTSAKFAGGMVGQTMGGTVEITNCVSGITINSSVNGDGTHGGFLAVASYGTVNFTGCMFGGEMLGESTTLWGGFVGWTESNNNATVTFTDCLFNPTNLTINSGRTFSRARNMSSVTITNCYYTEPLGTAQGLPAISDPNITPYGTPTGSYNVSNLVAYANGLMYGDTFYYDPNFVPPFEQTGTDEYTIHAATGWDFFCDAMQDNDTYGRFVGKTVKLGADISVTRMAGGSGHEFGGTFDGQGHTLTVSYQNTNGTVRTAPFSYVSGAIIKNLIVAGNITGMANRAAGIVGETGSSLSYVTNCVSSVNVSGSYYTGGVSVGGNVEITGCVFNGRIVGINNSGGFVGHSNSALVIRDCLFAPQEGSTISGGTFYFNGGGEITPVNSYYTVLLGTEQGHPAVSDPNIQPIGSPTGTYPLSNLTAYVNGLKYGDTFYYTPSVTQTIELSAGWNWISLYVELGDPVESLQMLEAALGDNAVSINASEIYTEYFGDGFWIGDLDDEGITNEQMYMIEVVNDCEIELEGMVANLANHAITIYPGWNWIGFPSSEELNLEDALADFEAEEGDQLTEAELYTEYGFGMWIGDVATLVPGRGYMYYSNSTQPKTLVFPSTSKGKTDSLRTHKE